MPTADSKRILIGTAGTLGDLLPFISLGRALVARGHSVAIACASGLHEWVKRAGLQPAIFDGDFGKDQAQRKAQHWNQWKKERPASSSSRYASFIRTIERNTRALAELASGADLLLSPTNCPEGRLAHELTGTPWLSVALVPEEALMPNDDANECFTNAMNVLCRNLALAEPYPSLRDLKHSEPTLFACSRALGIAHSSRFRQTGFWFYDDPEWARWKPDAELRGFMSADDPPLVLSFSSLPLEDPRSVLDVHVRAARLLKRRLVVQTGWSGFSRELLPKDAVASEIYMADFIPHDWFFSRAAGLITHGGIGTLGRALRNACPVLIEPYGNDQFFNALLLKRLGYGAAAHPLRLTPDGLAGLIQDHLLNTEARERLTQAATIIREENGLSTACDLIDDQLNKNGAVA